jgi:Plasmid pRiA4b ORF-3-like protein
MALGRDVAAAWDSPGATRETRKKIICTVVAEIVVDVVGDTLEMIVLDIGLHLTIQAAMAWTNGHLYEISAGGVGWSTPYPDADWAGDFIDARKARLGDIVEDIGTKTLKYLYDFGDGWEHTIKVERLIDPEPGILYPRLIEAKATAHPRTSVVLGAMASSLRPSPIPADRLSEFVAELAQPRRLPDGYGQRGALDLI